MSYAGTKGRVETQMNTRVKPCYALRDPRMPDMLSLFIVDKAGATFACRGTSQLIDQK